MALQSTGIILREETNPDLTTKNAELTFQELDENFIFIYEDLKALSGSGALPAWVVSTTYSQNVVVSYDGLIWKYVNVMPSAGVVPGSDPLFWVQLAPTELTHVQNSDTKLAEGTADEVSANEIRTFIDNPPTAGNIYNDDGVVSDPVRLIDMNGNIVRFDNGQFVIGDPLGSSYFAEINGTGETKRGLYVTSSGLVAVRAEDTTGTSLNGVTNTGISVYGLANAVGIAVHGNATTAGSIAGWFVGKSLIEETSTAVFNSSALLEVNSTVKGSLPLPRMNTTQKNAIVSPATGLSVFDTTNNRPEYFNGTVFQGMTTRFINISHAAYGTPAGGALAHFGAIPVAPQTAGGVLTAFNFTMRGNGFIRGCNFVSWASGTPGSAEAWEVYILVNNTTAYLVASVSTTNPIRNFNNSALNISFVDGDLVRMYYKNPASWSSTPTQIFGQGTLVLQ